MLFLGIVTNPLKQVERKSKDSKDSARKQFIICSALFYSNMLLAKTIIYFEREKDNYGHNRGTGKIMLMLE